MNESITSEYQQRFVPEMEECFGMAETGEFASGGKKRNTAAYGGREDIRGLHIRSVNV